MNNINFNSNAAEIRLKKCFYPAKSLERTVDAFSNGFEIEIEEGGREFRIEIRPKFNSDIKKAGYQFLNYLLSEIKKDKSPRINI